MLCYMLSPAELPATGWILVGRAWPMQPSGLMTVMALSKSIFCCPTSLHSLVAVVLVLMSFLQPERPHPASTTAM